MMHADWYQQELYQLTEYCLEPIGLFVLVLFGAKGERENMKDLPIVRSSHRRILWKVPRNPRGVKIRVQDVGDGIV